MFPLPSYPTPVQHCAELGSAHAELWLKNDGLCHALYGGSKVRKAERLVAEAVARGARRVVSVGAVGSHHLLTLTLFARAAGLATAAVVFPQRRSEHAVQTLRAAVGQGLEAHAARGAAIPLRVAQLLRGSDYLIPPGGSNAIGTRACADAIDELIQQVEAGLLPLPDAIVVPLGSGGTCAGLAAGVVRRDLPCRVIGVQVVPGPVPRLAARWLAERLLSESTRQRRARLSSQLRFDRTQLGPGYGWASDAGQRAEQIAHASGLELDQTYTAKAFAAALALVRNRADSASVAQRPYRVLYWHTLCARPLAPLLTDAPSEAALPRALRESFF